MAKIIQCKAAVAWAPNEPLKIEMIDVSPPQHGEVRVRLTAASLCHTDSTILAGVDLGVLKPRFPIIVGHEAAGIIESIGEGVTSVKPGDTVVLVNMPQCRRCKFCLGNKTNVCLEFDDNIGVGFIDKKKTTRFQCRGQPIHHCIGVSSLTEYTVCREEFVAKINPAAKHENVCLLSCGVLTGYGAALNSAKVEPGSICGVWGLGAVGLGAVLGCKKAGATQIIAMDTNVGKFEIARKLGATACLDPSSPKFGDEISRLTNGDLLDYAIECVGKLSAMRQAIEMSNKNWGLTTICGASPVDAEFCVGNAIQFPVGRRINGSWMGGFKTRDSVPGLVEEHLAGKLPLADFITHRVKLDEISTAFDLFKTGNCVKVIITF